MIGLLFFHVEISDFINLFSIALNYSNWTKVTPHIIVENHATVEAH